LIIAYTSQKIDIGAADSACIYCVPAALRLHSNAFYVAWKGIGTGFWGDLPFFVRLFYNSKITLNLI